jgi:putative tryptophan/tyrosine transport system substrate-binding protein
MKRREFIALLAGIAAYWPWSLRAQPGTMPVIGFLRPSTAAGSEYLLAAFRRGLNEAGFAVGRNVALEHRWAEGRLERLPGLADDLVGRRVALILASASAAAIAAKAVTSTIPIVFVTAIDPVKAGLVTNLNRPGGNATGITYLTSALAAKRLELIHEIVPTARTIAVIVNLDNPTTEPFMRDLRAGADALGVEIRVANVASASDLDGAFARLLQHRPGALIVGASPVFTDHAAELTALAARHAIPAIYTQREFTAAGGLMTWGTSLSEQYRLAGIHAGKVLKGAKPADLPVLQPTKYDLVINLKAAKTIGLDIPARLLALADEVIE